MAISTLHTGVHATAMTGSGPAAAAPFSPAELAFARASLLLAPPVRPDRFWRAQAGQAGQAERDAQDTQDASQQVRPLFAVGDVAPAANGSARVRLAGAGAGGRGEVGSEAYATVIATATGPRAAAGAGAGAGAGGGSMARGGTTATTGTASAQEALAVRLSVPGLRTDDPFVCLLQSVLACSLSAASAASQPLDHARPGHARPSRLAINRRWAWSLTLEVSPAPHAASTHPAHIHPAPLTAKILLLTPLSSNLSLVTLVSVAAHLAMRTTRLPRPITSSARPGAQPGTQPATIDDDPLFDDDWAASLPLYPPPAPARATPANTESDTDSPGPDPPLTLLLAAVGDTVLVDPSARELAVADACLAVSFLPSPPSSFSSSSSSSSTSSPPGLRLLGARSIDPPSRLTAAGLPNALNLAITAPNPSAEPAAPFSDTLTDTKSHAQTVLDRDLLLGSGDSDQSAFVWRPPRGGVKREIIKRMIRTAVQPHGPGEQLLQAINSLDSGTVHA